MCDCVNAFVYRANLMRTTAVIVIIVLWTNICVPLLTTNNCFFPFKNNFFQHSSPFQQRKKMETNEIQFQKELLLMKPKLLISSSIMFEWANQIQQFDYNAVWIQSFRIVILQFPHSHSHFPIQIGPFFALIFVTNARRMYARSSYGLCTDLCV